MNEIQKDPEYQKMNNQSERREFNRFQIEFLIEISAKDKKGEIFHENTVLKNISGGGAKFTTWKTDQYFLGQELKMTLFLPGTGEVNAHMSVKAQVMRINLMKKECKEKKNGEGSVAVRFDTLLNFEREDLKTSENQ